MNDLSTKIISYIRCSNTIFANISTHILGVSAGLLNYVNYHKTCVSMYACMYGH